MKFKIGLDLISKQCCKIVASNLSGQNVAGQGEIYSERKHPERRIPQTLHRK